MMFTLSYQPRDIMGILDFREICSPKSDHSSVINAAIGISNCPDDYELFCQEFFTLVKRFRIIKAVAKGPDFGLDLKVEEITKNGPIKWLVSCKHYGHSNSKIDVECSIVETVSDWDCDGFIPFYSMPPNVTIRKNIDGAEKYIKVERYDKTRIERELLDSPIGIKLASRYFPKSLTNHYNKFVETVNVYKDEDITVLEDKLKLAGYSTFINTTAPEEIEKCRADLLAYANSLATTIIHQPYFEKAMEQAIKLYPLMFIFSSTSSYKSIVGYEPTWDTIELLKLSREQGRSKAYFICTLWTFWDSERANQVFAEYMTYHSNIMMNVTNLKHEAKQIKKSPSFKKSYDRHLSFGYLSLGLVGKMLPETERDIAARLFAFC